jgi:TPR repeat protein
MKKKSGHRRRTKVVHKSRKNLRRTNKRKRLGKGRRRPTRRYSRIQRGGLTKEELKELEKKADAGDANAMFKLGEMYYHGNGVDKNDAKTLQYFEKAAAQGNARAMFELSVMYELGRGVERDYDKAFKYMKLAAEQGYANAQYHMGYMFYDGLGVAQDYAEAFKWFKFAAAQGDARADINLGIMLAKGEGVDKSDEEALKYFNLVLKNGELKKIVSYGNLEGVLDNIYSIMTGDSAFYNNDDVKTFQYEMGEEFNGRYAEAARWYRLAADHGHIDAQFKLGRLFSENTSIRNFTEALKYMKLAADKMHPYAMYDLGEMYYHGNGVGKNVNEALKYFNYAKDNMDPSVTRNHIIIERITDKIQRINKENKKYQYSYSKGP